MPFADLLVFGRRINVDGAKPAQAGTILFDQFAQIVVGEAGHLGIVGDGNGQ